MAKIDVYYRAFRNYRKETKEHKECLVDIQTIRNSQLQNDILDATKYLCHIDEEWVKRIEEGLVFVEKALAEERQFIRSDGEIVPIEKVKKISRSSVEHLAKHSNFITHVPEDGGDVVPDKLYMVEKLSDYAVYENRFLFMLLTYLHEFIMFRLEKIEKNFGTYDGNLQLNKVFESENKVVKYDIKITEHRENNPYPIHDEEAQGIIQRIKDCDQIVNAMLNTDLMVQVAKSPMIKPPITKTNVLKMNNNFKNALALYDYIAGYSGKGFEIEEVKTSFHPLKDVNGLEIAEALNLTSFIAYKIGNEIEDVLNTSYEEEEERRRQIEAQKLVDRIARLKKKAKDNNQSLEEYMLALEDRNKQLEHDAQELIVFKNKVAELNKVIDDLNIQKAELNHKIDDLNKEIVEKIKEIDRLNQKYIDDMAAAKKRHEEEMAELSNEYENKIVSIKEAHQDEINNIQSMHQDEINSINERHEQEIEEINQTHQEDMDSLQENFTREKNAIVDSYNKQVTKLNEKLQETITRSDKMKANFEDKIQDLNDALKDQVDERKSIVKGYESKLKNLEETSKETIEGEQRRNRILKREKDMMRAEMNAMRIENGKLAVGDEYITKERFDELEDEYVAFQAFFKDQWQYTKKEIRKSILWAKREKHKKVNAPVEILTNKEKSNSIPTIEEKDKDLEVKDDKEENLDNVNDITEFESSLDNTSNESIDIVETDIDEIKEEDKNNLD